MKLAVLAVISKTFPHTQNLGFGEVKEPGIFIREQNLVEVTQFHDSFLLY